MWRLDANNDRLRAMPNNDELMEQFTIKDSSHGAAALPAGAAAGLIAQVAAPAPIVTPEPRNRRSWCGLGELGLTKFLHIERKMRCVAHSHPPSHYMHKHAPGWLLVVFTTRRMQNTTSCPRSVHAATLNCAHTAKDNVMAFLSYEIEQLSFSGGPVVFQHFARFATSMHGGVASNKHSVVRHLSHPNLLVRCDKYLRRMASHINNPTLPVLTRATCVLWTLDSQVAQRRLYFTSHSLCKGLAKGLIAQGHSAGEVMELCSGDSSM